MLSPQVPSAETALLRTIANPNTPEEHVSALRQLSNEVSTNLERTRELTIRNEAVLAETEKNRQFVVKASAEAETKVLKIAEEAEKTIANGQAILARREQDVTAREQAVSTREQKFAEREQNFLTLTNQRNQEFDIKTKLLNESEERLKFSRSEVDKFKLKYEQSLEKLRSAVQ